MTQPNQKSKNQELASTAGTELNQKDQNALKSIHFDKDIVDKVNQCMFDYFKKFIPSNRQKIQKLEDINLKDFSRYINQVADLVKENWGGAIMEDDKVAFHLIEEARYATFLFMSTQPPFIGAKTKRGNTKATDLTLIEEKLSLENIWAGELADHSIKDHFTVLHAFYEEGRDMIKYEPVVCSKFL